MRSIVFSVAVFSLVGGHLFANDLLADDAKPVKPKAKPANPAYAQIEDDPALPRVLLIGDSISIAYTLPVRELLKGKANVHRPPTNCGPTTNGVKNIDAWLGDKPWDLIHFNFGLHDLKYLGGDGSNLADPSAKTSHQQVPLADYETNLRAIVKRLQQTGAVLIWRNTTPVPQGAKGRVPGDSAKYNEAAAQIMKEAGIAIDDMYGYSKPRLSEIQLKANVHFNKEGSQWLAGQVVESINQGLETKSAKPQK